MLYLSYTKRVASLFLIVLIAVIFIFSLTAYAEDEPLIMGKGETYKATLPKTENSLFVYDYDIISISDDGTITAVNTGTTDIMRCNEKILTVTVMKEPSEVALNETELTLGVGEIFNFNSKIPEGEYSYKKNYSCDKDILTYMKSGFFKAEKEGSALVIVETYNGKTANCTVTVKSAPEKISLNKKKITVGEGETFTLTPKLNKGSASNKITYSFSKKGIVKKVSENTFIAQKDGKVKITATTYNGKKATVTVTVKNQPDEIYVSSCTMTIGKSEKIKTIFPENTFCSHFTYKSADPSIVSVDKKGKMKARKNGSTKITVTSFNQKKTSFTVTVNAMKVPFVNQYPCYPTGCEAASCVSLLAYYGYKISLKEMIDIIPSRKIKIVNGKRVGPDINECFIGDPKGTYTSGTPGYGIFSPGVAKSLNKALNKANGKHKAEKIENCTWKMLLQEVSEGNPAIIWATYQMLVPKTVNSWYIPQEDGSYRYFEYPRGTHVMVIIGHSDNYVTIMDPIKGKVSFKKSTFKNRWNLLGNQAVVLRKAEKT